ncbi:chitin deacetylase, partial [Mortierella sp. AD031]
IVIEVRWAEKAIEDITGIKVRYIRPLNGDVDNRVRFVLKKLGYTIVDLSGIEFDTRDFELKKTLKDYTKKTPKQGFITLSHDYSQSAANVAREIIALGLDSGLKIQSIATCLHDNSPYTSISGQIQQSVAYSGSLNAAGFPQPPPDASSNTARPPSGHVDYNDYYTMEGQMLNKLIASAKSQGAQPQALNSASSFPVAGGGWHLLWALFGSVIWIDHALN